MCIHTRRLHWDSFSATERMNVMLYMYTHTHTHTHRLRVLTHDASIGTVPPPQKGSNREKPSCKSHICTRIVYVCVYVMYVCMHMSMFVRGTEREAGMQATHLHQNRVCMRVCYVCVYAYEYVCKRNREKPACRSHICTRIMYVCVYVYVCMYTLVWMCKEAKRLYVHLYYRELCTHTYMRVFLWWDLQLKKHTH
jgi:hypothetical protein